MLSYVQLYSTQFTSMCSLVVGTSSHAITKGLWWWLHFLLLRPNEKNTSVSV